MKKRFYGVDIGGTTVKVGLLENGYIVRTWSVHTDTSNGGRRILPDIIASLPGPADGAALAVPGAVLPNGTVNKCVNLGWGICRPGEEFTAETGIPCRVLNDANAAALGEQRLGGGMGYESVLFVALGTGVGAGVVLNGKLRVGARGTAGELGHLIWDPDDAEAACSCGHKGCLEQYCSATGIVRLATGAGFPGLSCKEIVDRAAAGDRELEAVVDKATNILGWGIAGACAILDPEAVVLGGGVAQAGEFFRQKVQVAFDRYAFHACLGTHIRLATLGSDAGLTGAALFAADHSPHTDTDTDTDLS